MTRLPYQGDNHFFNGHILRELTAQEPEQLFVPEDTLPADDMSDPLNLLLYYEEQDEKEEKPIGYHAIQNRISIGLTFKSIKE